MQRMLLVLCLSLVSTAVASADAQGAVEGYFLSGFGDGEFGDGDGADESVDLDPTLGFGLRGEAFLHEYFALGGGAEFSWFRPDNGNSAFHFDLSINLRPRFLLFGDGNMALELYALVPIGFSRTAGWEVDTVVGEIDFDPMIGWHIGAGAGTRLRIDRFAAFAEIGWRRTQVFGDVQIPVLGERDTEFLANQFRFHLGASIAL